ncbi:hypothetical protein SAMN05421820_10128 [Pedobacter steynii]|uniref:Uncharacterized protein n=1 Tax=Pedobacter steynii TaxID=430522 RepID=A0A1G9IR77_9SPHI|nr:hypothetical protein [Pedobacter steynii]NQX38020.1 hypothetical protein [Pedobacter steynii]SDL27565.1 hypothetical protein SAMN05421820_10128 [Pedobacter steynii]
MEKLDKRVTALENTISTLLQHMQQVNHNIATGFEKVEKHFEYVDKNFAIVNRNIELIKGDIDLLKEDVDLIKGNIDLIKGDINLVKGDIDLIKGNSTASLETIENSILNLTAEISKINDTSGYRDLHANMKKVSKL